ncbi:hypothetical protein HJC99_01140 [Candidatus Saccharibacteria bacterium]|nr:hypothetical protein [Candidatus Saccharibacteria bacterium]
MSVLKTVKTKPTTVVSRISRMIGVALILVGCISAALGFWLTAGWSMYAILGGFISLIVGGVLTKLSQGHVIEALLSAVFGGQF